MHLAARSTTSLAPARSRAQLVPLKWWQRRPILPHLHFVDLQRGSQWVAFYCILQCLLQMSLSIVDTYCLALASPGSRYFRSVGFSFLFVYSGNQHVRRLLMTSAIALFLGALFLLVTTVKLLVALRREYESDFLPWMRAMVAWSVLRLVLLVFQSTANDLYFGYHQAMLVIWLLLLALNVFGFVAVLSNYQELCDIAHLEDVARSKALLGRAYSAASLGSVMPPGSSSLSVAQPITSTLRHHYQREVSHQSQPNLADAPPRPISQNSLHTSYLQMYTAALSQRSQSAGSISVDSMPLYATPQRRQQTKPKSFYI